MNIVLYKNRAEPNRVDKTNFLEAVNVMKGNLKNSTSIINPVIVFDLSKTNKYVMDGNGLDVTDNGIRITFEDATNALLVSNYCYIPEFGRYYYIDDIISLRTGLWEISMSVDVLMSNKEKIATQVAMVARNEFEYDEMLNDPLIPSKNKPIVTIEEGYNINDGMLIETGSENHSYCICGLQVDITE